MIRYKVDVLAVLKDSGFSSYKLRKEKLIGEATIQQIRSGELASWKTIDTICRLINCQPGDLIEYVAEAEEE